MVELSADTLYLCYCIDKAQGKRPRDEVLLAFEYDGTADGEPAALGALPGSVVLPMHRQHVPGAHAGPSGHYAASTPPRENRHGTRPMPIPIHPETIVPRSPLDAQGSMRAAGRRETLFDAGAEVEGYDMSGDEENARRNGWQDRRRHQQSQGQQQLQQGARHGKTAQRAQGHHGYEESEDSVGGEGRTPTARRPHGQGHESVEEEDDDEMNPFRQSAHGETFDLPSHRAGASAGMFPIHQTLAGTSTSPRAASFGFVAAAHAFNVRGGVPASPARLNSTGNAHTHMPMPTHPQQPQRMLSSTQELNMKSQFLMNMRAFGAESEASAAGSAAHLEASGTSTASTASAVPLGASSVAPLDRSEAEAGAGAHVGASASGYEEYMEESGVGGGERHEHAGDQAHEHGDDQEHPGEKSDGEESMLGPGSGFFN